MTDLEMPATREFGWALKPVETTHFEIIQKPNGQVAVVLNHALLRGVTSDMLRWWFQHFTRMQVRLRDVPSYEGQVVPAYWLWHPVDHLSATLSGATGPNGTPKAGCKILIREAMQYDRYGWRYKVDQNLTVFEVTDQSWAMGKAFPVFGPAMALRIQFRDVYEAGAVIGAHYHYEVAIGVAGSNPLARLINNRITRNFGAEFFAAWHRHNVIEVGTFENFLPNLYAQRSAGGFEYSPDTAQNVPSPNGQKGHDRTLFDTRVAAYRAAADPHAVQGVGGAFVV